MTEEKKGISSAAPPGRLGKLGYGFLWLCPGVVCLWTVCTIAIYWLFPDWQTRGAVGDSFGAVSALFSGLAFAGLIYALHLQRKELRYQRDPRKVPALLVIALFKNVVGAHFRLRRAFQLYAHGGQAESLQHWATRLAAFQVEYKSQLTDLRELRRKGQEDKWEYLFEKLKDDFSGSVTGPETVALHAEAVPASFSLECISPEDFQREMSFASYPQIVGALYDCRVELDMRGKS